MGFVFEICVVYDHAMISNSIIMFDSRRVFADCVLFYLLLFTLTYVFPICYVIQREDNVLAENQIVWDFSFNSVVR